MALRRRGFVRAPERSRTALAAYREPYLPWLHETGVDRLEIKVGGAWLTEGHSEYPNHLAQGERFPTWMTQPQRSDRRIKLESSTSAAETTTLRSVEVLVHRPAASAGTIKATVVCNPTRTLAHLLKRYRSDDFLGAIGSLSPEDFFAIAPDRPARSLDDNDNWLDDPDRTRAALGRNHFSAFLPVFVEQVYALLLQLIAPLECEDFRYDGTEIVAESAGSSVRLHGNNVSVPKIETYFERHHSRAAAAVHLAAQRALFSLDEANAFLHFDRRGLSRDRGSLAILANIPSGRRISIYAKAPERIRFEVRRLDRGRYGPRGAYVHPSDRLLQMIEYERQYLLRACDWTQVGRMFAETPFPSVADLTDLLSEVLDACVRHSQEPKAILTTLLREGALPTHPDDNPNYKRMIQLLRRQGVLDRVTLRLRDQRTGVRLASLRYEHTLIYEALANALDGSAACGIDAEAT